MQRRFLAFALVVVSFLGSSPARADEPEVGSVLPGTEKPFEPTWTIVGVATFTTDNLSQVGGGVRLGGEF